MNLAESPSPSPSSSSGSDDFATLLDSELELASAADPVPVSSDSAAPSSDDDDKNLEENEAAEMAVEVESLEQNGTKRHRVQELHQYRAMPAMPSNDTTGSSKNAQVDVCPHPGYFGGLCFRCGKPQAEEAVSGVAFGYIHKELRLGTSEIDRLRGADLKNLLRGRKLVLILDLDHTLINSTRLQDISSTENELGIPSIASKDDPNRSIFTLGPMNLLTKLRPFVKEFLKEASSMFEMSIYTMGDKAYAIEIAKLLDPDNIYFSSKVISNSDCTQRHQKGLDVVLGAESVAVILDDSANVWQKHKENLILMERYHYFASSCKQFGAGVRSWSESMHDERENDGALATILDVLKRIHTVFFDSAVETDLSSRDVREVIKAVRKEVLQGCTLVFGRLFPRDAHRPQDHYFWKMVEQLGAVCRTDVDSMVTRVVAMDRGTDKALWATINNQFLVQPRWLEAANFRWCRQPEEDFPVPHSKKKVKENSMASHHEETSKDKGNIVAGEKEMAQDKDTVTAGGEEKPEEIAVSSIATTTASPAESQAM